jgi:Neuraminidase (sialidase)
MKVRIRRLAMVVGPVMLLVGAGAGGAAEPLRLTTNVQATKEDVDPTRTYSAPYLAVDPANDLHIVGSFIDFRSARCGLIRSLDGGQTWKRMDAFPAPDTFPFCESTQSGNGIYHAPLAFGRNGTLYYAVMGWDNQDGGGGRGNTSVILARSDDLGETWERTLVRNNRGKEGPAVENIRPMTGIAVDSKTGRDDTVYVSYSRRLPNAVAPNAEPNQPTVAVSTDGGRTFGEPVSVVGGVFANAALRADGLSKATTTTAPPGPTTTTTAPIAGSRAAQPDQEANFGGGKSSIAVDGKGTIYVAWPSAVANVAAPPPPAKFISKSTDQGKTWTVTQIASWSYAHKAGAPGPNASLQLAWSPKGGPEGTLHVVAEGNDEISIANLSHIWYWRSTDGGRTWSTPKVIDDSDKSQMVGQYMPDVSVAPNGRVDVTWWDTRDTPVPGTQTNDVYYTSSFDNGETWSRNVRVTDRSISRRYGVFLNNFNMSAPPGLASTNAYAVLGWDDTRLTDPNFADNAAVGGGLQDIFTAAVQYEAVGGGTSSAVKLALAAVVGLLAVGLILFVAALTARRGRDGSAPGSARADRERAGVG